MTKTIRAAALGLLLAAPWAATAASTPPPPSPTPPEPAAAAAEPAATGNTTETTDPSGPEGDRVVVVTATRTATEAAKTTASVTVIDRKEIEAAQYRTVAEAVRRSPGLSLVGSGTQGLVTGVFTRGTKTSDTQVLIDGRRLPFNLAGSYNLESLSLDNVERIEVARGPLSSVQGGASSGGVINILTRGGKGLERPEHELTFEAGSYGTFREIAASRGAFGPFDYSVEASRLDTENQRPNNEYRQTAVAAKPGVQVTRDVYLDLLFTYNLGDAGSPNTVADPHTAANLLRETWLVSPRVVWDTTEWWQQTLVYAYSRQRQAAVEFPTLFGLNFGQNNRVQADTHQLDYQSTFQIASNWSLTPGVSVTDTAYYRKINTANEFAFPVVPAGTVDVDNAVTTTAVFLATQWDVIDRWRVDGSVRLDHNSDYGNPVTWRVGTVYEVPHLLTRIRASYGTAFSPPTPQDVAPALFGNPAVTVERSQGYEAGLEQPFWDGRVTVGATYFRNRSANQLIFNSVSFALENIGIVTNEGWEVTLSVKPHETLELAANYTNTDALNRNTGARLVRRPVHELGAEAIWRPIPALTFTSGLTWVADRTDFTTTGVEPIEDYLVCRLTAAWQAHEHVQVFGRVENLTGEDYVETFGFPALDTGLYAGVKLSY